MLLLAVLYRWQHSILARLPFTSNLANGIGTLDNHVFVRYLALLEAHG
jgi:hypothetical protein